MKKGILFVLLAICCKVLFAQGLTQTVKGTVIDRVSEKPLQGAVISILGKKTITNSNGNYTLNNISVGRVAVSIGMTGYKPVMIPEVLITTGKEVVIDAALEQDIKALADVTVSSSRIKKGNASNEFAGASSRSFSTEEITRFAGGRNDPSKMVSNFAGVVSANDSRNDIVVRGNSPTGVLWRIEGIPSPSPNHFATQGTTGGPVSALNTNALKTSDFYTGAFPAEYGNANAAVFDIQLRAGNSDKQESTVQLNLFSGLEAMIEGPMSRQKKGDSYMIGYRYSFVQIGQSLGLNVGTKSIPKYQDWVYNIQLAKGKFGKINFFGMGGISNINFIGKDIDTTDFYARQDQDGYSSNNFAVVGAKHTIDVSNKSYIRTVVSYASTKSDYDQYQYALPLTYSHSWLNYQAKTSSSTIRMSSFINTKFNAQLSWRTGFLSEFFHTASSVISKDGQLESAPFQIQQNYNGNSSLVQAYSQLRYKPVNNLTLTGGLHAMLYSANSSKTIEPRFGINYELRKGSLFFNYGLHSQMQPLPVYYTQSVSSSGAVNDANKNLGFTKADHWVLGYERRFIKNWRVKAETYYQYLYNVPVEVAASGFSILNAGADFTFPDKAGLVNKGTGKNYGAELTVEKFLSKGFYVLSSTSVFSSKYKGSDGIERNTSFNYGYAANMLAGKEWKMGKSDKNTFTVDFKVTTIGGRYATPVDITASIAQNKEVLDETKYNSEQLKGYFRMDTKFGFRVNSSKHKLSQTFYLDLQNVTNNKNIFLRRYNPEKQTVGDVNQIGFFPDILYRLQF